MTIKIEDLKDGERFKSDLMLDEKFLLLPTNAEIPENFLKTLKEWHFNEVVCAEDEKKQTPAEQKNNAPDSPEMPQTINQNDSTPPPHKNFASSQKKTSVEKTVETISIDKNKLFAENSDDFADFVDEPVEKNGTLDSNELSRMEIVQQKYQEHMEYINTVYTRFATHREISYEGLADMVKNLCVFIRDNKRYVLRVSPSSEARNKNFLVIHSMRSAVIAITIGLELHLDFQKLTELGIATILHEIGMLRLPPQLYITNRVLSPQEKAQISMHPLHSYNILKELNFPLSTQLGVLEHHEKETGQGYPRHLTGDKISPYAKIISVACSFEAITAPRTYKTERTTYDAMVEMLRNPNHQYDANTIKALLYSISLYPIGTYVYLHGGKVGVVLDVNPNNPKNPIIQMIYEKDSDGSPKTVQTDDGANKIERMLSKEEQKEVVENINRQIEVEKQKKEERQKAVKAEREARATANAQKSAAQKKKEEFSSVDLSDFV